MQSVHFFLLIFFDRKKFVGEFILQALRRPRVLVLIDFLVSLFRNFQAASTSTHLDVAQSQEMVFKL